MCEQLILINNYNRFARECSCKTLSIIAVRRIIDFTPAMENELRKDVLAFFLWILKIYFELSGHLFVGSYFVDNISKI
jgi:hypothetical protein